MYVQYTHMEEPGQCPAGSRVIVKLRAGKSMEGSRFMATGSSIGRPLRNGASWVKPGSCRSREQVTSEQNRRAFLGRNVVGRSLINYIVMVYFIAMYITRTWKS